MATKIQLRHDSAKNWRRVNPTLLAGEMGIEVDTRRIKVGDGEKNWALLDYAVAGNGASTVVNAGLEIGDIGIAPLGIDESKNRKRYLNGQTINVDDFLVFATLIEERVKEYPSLQCTEEEFEEDITTYGQCGKFVLIEKEYEQKIYNGTWTDNTPVLSIGDTSITLNNFTQADGTVIECTNLSAGSGAADILLVTIEDGVFTGTTVLDYTNYVLGGDETANKWGGIKTLEEIMAAEDEDKYYLCSEDNKAYHVTSTVTEDEESGESTVTDITIAAIENACFIWDGYNNTQYDLSYSIEKVSGLSEIRLPQVSDIKGLQNLEGIGEITTSGEGSEAVVQYPYYIQVGREIETDQLVIDCIIQYLGREITYKVPNYIQADKQTITFKAGTTIKVNTLQKQIDEDLTYNVVDLLDEGTELVNGKDYCVYLTDEDQFVVSLNSTYPVGHEAENVRKIGGFHTLCVAVSETTAPALAHDSFWESHPAIGYNAGDIIPNSVWTTAHRPYCDPSGMVYIDGRKYGIEPFWVDIYLQSGIFSETLSVYGGSTTRTRNSILHQYDMLLVGKKLPTDHQFMIFAEGSNQKTAIYGSALPSTPSAGGHVDTASIRMISGFFVEECCGYIWQWLDELAPVGGSGWLNYADTNRGDSYDMPYMLGAGGRYDDSTHCGSWSRASGVTRSGAYADIGARGVSCPVPYTTTD